jgi:hypothetical protein
VDLDSSACHGRANLGSIREVNFMSASFLGESDYAPEQVEAWATDAAETFIEQMDESHVFLKDEITGFEIALQIIDRS